MNTFRAGGHLIDNLLTNMFSKDKQVSTFDSLRQETKDKIALANDPTNLQSTIELINRKGHGIQFTEAEVRLLFALMVLLHKKSENEKVKDQNFYAGNKGVETVPYSTPNGSTELQSPNISVTLYEVTKEYYGGKAVGGENVQVVAELLNRLAEDPTRRALVRYSRHVKLGKNKSKIYALEMYAALITVATGVLTDVLNGKPINEKKEMIIQLHPVFIDSIKSKYVVLPVDINKRIDDAVGHPNVSIIVLKLLMELYRAFSNRNTCVKDEDGNPVYPIGEDKLFNKIATGYLNPKTGKLKRRKVAHGYFQQAVEIAKTVGLLIKHEVKNGVKGDSIHHFTLVPKLV
ncbi:MAG: hypothetical protein ABI778_02035 [Ignavibacteriota bacterium]